MTPDQRVLVVWGGVGGAIIVVGCIALAMRGSTLSEITPRARSQHATYLKLYHPDRPQEGMPAAEALQELNKAKERQDNALHKVEAALVPDLPKGYLGNEVNSAAATIHADHATMKTRAQSQQMGLPSTLPLDSGPDKDEGKRAIQLAQLYLYRAVVDQCLDAGVSKITAITPG
ncbi:MAG: hypothetical protein H0W83_15750, partial [Planctomycetes bacterium]|nr:hypothetical protein [Planctomycetota bacterium]